jgi:hypothetical protein
MLRVALAACALVALPSHADVGIGVSAKTDSATVYIPITAGRFMFEPYVRATDRETESVSTTGTVLVLATGTASEVQANAVGLGIFRLVPLAERVTLYYGGRLARIDEKAESFAASGINVPPAFESPSQESTAEGASIAPTLGFHYSIIERLSIGAEIGLEHTKVDTDSINRSSSGAITQTSTAEITSTDTRANIILRFFF